MSNLADALLGPRETVGTQGIHSYKDVPTRPVLNSEPFLKRPTRDILRAKDALRGLFSAAIQDKDRDPIVRVVKR
jgi:hypothetical protein